MSGSLSDTAAGRLASKTEETVSRCDRWRVVLAVIWLVGFCVYFFTLPLPNNQNVPRLSIWQDIDLYLAAPFTQHQASSGWQYLPQRAGLLFVAGIIFAGAWGLGHLVLRGLRLPLAARCAERTVFAFALGLSGLSLLTLGFGLCGLLSRPLLGTLLAVCIVAEGILRFRGRPVHESTDSKPRPTDRRNRRRAVACLAVMTPFLLAMLAGAMLPSTDFDVKEYHLQGAKEFYQNGRISFLPHNVYTSFPFLTEMISLLAMVLRNDWFSGALAGKVVLMGFGPLTAVAVYAAGRRWFGPAAGWMAATVHLTVPWTYRISTIAYAEGGLAFFLFASLLAVMIGIEKLANTRPRENDSATTAPPAGTTDLSAGLFRQFLLAGLLAGSGMACKYPGVVSVVIPLGLAVCVAPFLLKLPTNVRFRIALRAASLFTLGVALTVGPWLLKNTIETGNPVYPLLYPVFGGRDWDVGLDTKWRHAHHPPDHDLRTIPSWMVDVAARNDWLSPLLYGLAFPAFFAVAGRRRVRWLWLYVAWLFLTWWVLTHRLDRFWVPMIPVVSLLAGVGAVWNRGRLWRTVCTLCVAVVSLFNLALVVSGACGYNAYLADLHRAQNYTARLTAPGIALLNEQLPRGAKVLCVGEAQVFDARFPVVYNTVFDHSIFQEWCAVEKPGTPAGDLSLRNPDEIARTFAKAGITHLLVNWKEILRYRTSYGYTDFVTPARFAKLRQAGILGPPINLGYADPADLGQTEQQEIDRWGPELNVPLRGKPAVTTSQLYPVRPHVR